MKTKLITLLIAIVTLSGICAIAQEKVINIYKGNSIISSYEIADIDSIKFANKISAPTNVVATESGNLIKITWSSVSQAQSYQVYRSNDNNNYALLASNITKTSYTDATPILGANYYKVKAISENGESSLSIATAPITITVDNQAETGLYMGIVGFNQTLTNKEISILAPNTKSTFTDFVTSLTSKNGTLLYYAVDNAIDALATSTLPNDLVNVAMVTFTDGLDQGSFMMGGSYESNEEYLSAVNNKIKNTKVQGLPISAYSIGLKGNDVVDYAQFQTNLNNLASSHENATEVTSMEEVNAKFQEIANQLYKENSVQTISLTIPGQANGTQIRFTFDNVSDVSQSQLFIDGTFSLSDRSLKNITYGGITAGSGSAVAGVQDGIFVTFTFNDLKAKDVNYESIPIDYIKQWSYIKSTGQWQINSEFDPASQTQTTVERKSAAIMLVLDCSSSLGTQFATMKTHANAFIEKMAEGTQNSTSGGNSGNGGGTTTENTHNGHAYVDLGLPSGIKWATCNVGADTPEEYGDYFAWGETTPQTKYLWSTYKYCDGDKYSMTKYCVHSEYGIVDYKTALELSDDAARVNWGGKWRMPTDAEQEELLNTSNCTWTWTTQNGVNGYKVTSKKNGNFIFLPAAGCHMAGFLPGAGNSGYYWSSSLNTYGSNSAYYLNFDSSSVDYGCYNRCDGRSVRAVCE